MWRSHRYHCTFSPIPTRNAIALRESKGCSLSMEREIIKYARVATFLGMAAVASMLNISSDLPWSIE
jgi:hypothetical protein